MEYDFLRDFGFTEMKTDKQVISLSFFWLNFTIVQQLFERRVYLNPTSVQIIFYFEPIPALVCFSYAIHTVFLDQTYTSNLFLLIGQ